jgi:hypothetical protein
MNPVDKIARLGWFATVTLALAMASACASTQAQTPTPVSTTMTTSAEVADRDGVELYFARLAASSKCGGDLRENVDFLPRSASIDQADMPDIDRWARCLNEPQMQHATVVLVGGQAKSEPDGLFVARAGRVRDALIARGVEARRIVIGTQNASRDGTPFAGNTGVRVETTHQQSLRAFVPPDTGARATTPIH